MIYRRHKEWTISNGMKKRGMRRNIMSDVKLCDILIGISLRCLHFGGWPKLTRMCIIMALPSSKTLNTLMQSPGSVSNQVTPMCSNSITDEKFLDTFKVDTIVV